MRPQDITYCSAAGYWQIMDFSLPSNITLTVTAVLLTSHHTRFIFIIQSPIYSKNPTKHEEQNTKGMSCFWENKFRLHFVQFLTSRRSSMKLVYCALFSQVVFKSRPGNERPGFTGCHHTVTSFNDRFQSRLSYKSSVQMYYRTPGGATCTALVKRLHEYRQEKYTTAIAIMYIHGKITFFFTNTVWQHFVETIRFSKCDISCSITVLWPSGEVHTGFEKCLFSDDKAGPGFKKSFVLFVWSKHS